MNYDDMADYDGSTAYFRIGIRRSGCFIYVKEGAAGCRREAERNAGNRKGCPHNSIENTTPLLPEKPAVKRQALFFYAFIGKK